MDWSIADVARMSGVTSRTLRHYDAIGLLPPTATGEGGVRRYDTAALLRLQRVLVLRALGLPLGEIGAVLDDGRDQREALEEHLGRVVAEQGRLARVAETVRRTLDELGRGGSGTMDIDRPERLFEGFDQEAYAQEARERWPEEAASSEAYTATLSADDRARLQREYADQMVRMAALAAAAVPVEDARVQEEVDRLHAQVSRMWTPDAAAFTGLGRMYVDDERFRRTYDRIRPGLAAYFRDAMAVYAADRLG